MEALSTALVRRRQQSQLLRLPQDSYLLHDGYTRKYLGRPLTACKVIEIGYGARPNRLIWFSGQGVDITGIDLDQPILRGKPSEFLQVYRRNGWERALKTVGRWFVNERNLRRTMLAELSHQRGKTLGFQQIAWS